MNHQTKGVIESDKALVRELFEQFWFSIPPYQRSYVWEKEEISELIDDVDHASKHSSSGQYFLGSMVLQKKLQKTSTVQGNILTFDVYDVLDGQQRLTTLLLMIAVIRDLTEKDESGIKLREVCKKMLHQEENPYSNTPERDRLVYHIRDAVGDFINEYVKPEDATNKKEQLASKAIQRNTSISNMAKGIQTLRDKLGSWASADLRRFALYLFNNALLIYVATEDLDDAFRLFTILNDRGVPLSSSDILKARNLGAVLDAKENNKWAKFWEDTETELGRDEFDRFLSFFRTIYVKEKAREGLLKEFDDLIYGTKPPLLTLGTATFKAIQEYKAAYEQSILYPNGAGNAYVNLIMIMQRSFPSTDWIPAVLAWYSKFKTWQLTDFVEKLSNKFSADWILQLTPTQRIQNVNDILKAVDKANSPNHVLSAFEVFKYDKDALLRMLKEDIYEKRFAKYVLLRLEYLYFNNSSALNLPDELSVEHILPQMPSPTAQWVADFTEDERNNWLHKIGNLMLLSRRKNTSLGNLDFVDKKKKYFEKSVETLPNSARVLTLQEFTPKVLAKRHDDLLTKLAESY